MTRDPDTVDNYSPSCDGSELINKNGHDPVLHRISGSPGHSFLLITSLFKLLVVTEVT